MIGTTAATDEHVPTGIYHPEEFERILSRGTTRPYAFRPHMDFVIIGECRLVHRAYPGNATLERLFGFGIPAGSDGKETPLHGHVLLISNCCGKYRPPFTLGLANAYPAVNWVIPNTRDYGAAPIPRFLREDLIAADLLHPRP